jgi:pSer/pThr/pTyr-binding forkhead associated (FHA) protein
MQYATIALLDGTVIGRLACDELLGEIVVGRGSAAGIRVDDPFVHRIHSEIRWDTALRSHVIAHGGGSNGTYVNLQRVDRPARLIDGARIRIGKTELIYRRVYYPGG